MHRSRRFLSAAAELLFFAQFGAAGIAILFFNRNTYFTFSLKGQLVSAVGCIAGIGLLFWLCRRCVARWQHRFSRIAVPLLWLLLLAMQAVCIHQLRLRYAVENWDMNVVYNAAMQFLERGALDAHYSEYFNFFPNNSALYNLLVLLFAACARYFPRLAPDTAMILFNTLLLNVAVLFLLASAKRLLGEAALVPTLLLTFLCCPFWLYTVVPYTDTVSMPFVAAGIWLWLCLRQSDALPRAKRIRLAAAFALTLALGAAIKITVLILGVACLIDFLLWEVPTWKRLARAAAMTAAVLLLVSLLGRANRNSPFLPAFDPDNSIPYTHWVMMGLSGDGGYNNDDYEQVTLRGKSTEERSEIIGAEIERRISALGAQGLTKHEFQKLSYLYGDGTYTATLKLSRGPVQVQPLHALFVYTEPLFGIFAYASFGVMAAQLFFCAASAVRDWRRRDASSRFLRIALLGITLFLLLWEARTRYFVNFLPAFLLCEAAGISGFFERGKHKK